VADCLILNSASLPFGSEKECDDGLGEFFSIVHRAHTNGVGFYRADNLEGDWNSLNYADGFQFGAWMNSQLDRDDSRVLMSVVGSVKCPNILCDDTLALSIKDMIFSLSADDDVEVQELGLASQLGASGISFSSHAHWAEGLIDVVRYWDDAGEMLEEEISVRNVSSLEHLDGVLSGIERKRQDNRNYLNTIVTVGNNDFPRLIFCDSALKNLQSNSVTIHDFASIVDVLKRLNIAIGESSSLGELIDKSGLDISGESSETMNCRKHARKREFKHPELGLKSFEVHVKNFPDGKRMHMLADYDKGVICIGYFGRHLSTVKHPK